MDWKNLYFPENEKPLDRLTEDGGFTAIFRTIACVGDSLSSGEFQLNDGVNNYYYDRFEHSWGQYLARMTGTTVYNFSKGGMRAETYCNSFAEQKGYWDPAMKAQAYIIALGVNDLVNGRKNEGSLDDVDFSDWHNNGKTFTGYYAQIIQRYKEIAPDAKFFLVTIPRMKSHEQVPLKQCYANIQWARMVTLAERFDNTYLIDLRRYGPCYDEEFKERFFLNGHMTPTGYLLTAKMIASYIDWIIRHNMDDFRYAGLIGTDLKKPGMR